MIFGGALATACAFCSLLGGAPSAQLEGVNVHPLWADSSTADFDRELDMAKAAGANSVRMDLSWSSLETEGKGEFSDWYVKKADTFLAHARARGLQVIATLWSTPCWASSAPEDLAQACEGAWWEREVHTYAPADSQDYADAAEWVARRWGTYLRAVEVWNEPNLEIFLKAPDPAEAYASILKAAYPRIKDAAPWVTVLGGSLAFSDGDFLTALYDEHAIKGSYDAIAYHPYNEGRDPRDPWLPQYRKYAFGPGTRWLREVMLKHGDEAVDLWITEFGFTTCAPGSSFWCVSEAEQARYTEAAYRIARERWPFVKAVINYNLRNKGSAPEDREAHFGLLRRDFSPKPAYAAFERALSR